MRASDCLAAQLVWPARIHDLVLRPGGSNHLNLDPAASHALAYLGRQAELLRLATPQRCKVDLGTIFAAAQKPKARPRGYVFVCAHGHHHAALEHLAGTL